MRAMKPLEQYSGWYDKIDINIIEMAGSAMTYFHVPVLNWILQIKQSIIENIYLNDKTETKYHYEKY